MNTRSLPVLFGALFSVSVATVACSSGGDSASGGGGGGGESKGFGGSSGAGKSTGQTTGHGGSQDVGGFNSGDGGSGTGSGHGGDGGGCGSVALHQTIVPGNIIVVFDQSDSMGGNFSKADGGGNGQTKWQAAEAALVASVQPNQDVLNLGAIFFPTGKCEVASITMSPQLAIAPGATFLTAFQAHFSDPHWTTISSTPLQIALEAADAAFPDPSPLKGDRAVIVLTDGKPTCSETDDQVLAPVLSMAARGIKTYAIGLPGSQDEAGMLLDSIAQDGETGSYISPSSPMDLQQELATIAQKTLNQCSYTLDPPPADPSKVYLIVTDAAHPKGEEVMMGTTDGWTLSSDGTHATLEGKVCDNAQAGKYDSVTFVYGCPSLPR